MVVEAGAKLSDNKWYTEAISVSLASMDQICVPNGASIAVALGWTAAYAHLRSQLTAVRVLVEHVEARSMAGTRRLLKTEPLDHLLLIVAKQIELERVRHGRRLEHHDLLAAGLLHFSIDTLIQGLQSILVELTRQ